MWHKYDTYIHFKCNDKKCNHSFKLPVWIPKVIQNQAKPMDSINTFKGFRFSPKIILAVLSIYFSSSSSTRQIKKILKRLFSIKISHVTIHKWTKKFSDHLRLISTKLLLSGDFHSDEWHADETVVKISGIKHYLWVLLDSETRCVIAYYLSPYRSSTSAAQLFQQALLITTSVPKTIITDRLDSYNVPIDVCFPTVRHYPYKGFKDYLNNNFIESFNKTFKAWYKTKKSFKNFCSAQQLITVFMFHYNFLHTHTSLNNLSPANVAGIIYTDKSAENWFLI